MKSSWVIFLVGFIGAASICAQIMQGQEEKQVNSNRPFDAAVERTRKQVRMLDDIYKGGIVMITEHYVHDETDLPAGTAFKKLFEAAKNNGWHEVRLLDATGEPYNDENVAQTLFEREAIKQLKEGKPYVDQVVTKQGKRYLLAATPIPVVMKKCIMCHDHYADVSEGGIVGALGYTVPIE